MIKITVDQMEPSPRVSGVTSLGIIKEIINFIQ
jgi:hypothetical protein